MNLPKSPFNCKRCDDSGTEIVVIDGKEYAQPCTCKRVEIKVNAFGEKFRHSTLENYIEKNQSMKVARRTLLKNPNGSFFIFGNVNLGKTHLLAAFYELQFKERYKKIKVYKESQLKHELQSSIVGHYGYKQNPKEIAKDMLKDVEAVFIDDIGKVQVDDKSIESLFTFYDTITERGLQLVVSANYPLSEMFGSDRPSIAKIYGAAIASRFERCCDLIEVLN